jgi:uncharacterized membrane protein YhaH (DUF805 family)
VRLLVEFIFPRRLHRLAYFLRLIVVNVFSSFLYADRDTMAASYWWAVVVALSLYGIFFILLPRLRDVGMSTWWLIVALIPVANILLGIILLFRAPEYHFASSARETPET